MSPYHIIKVFGTKYGGLDQGFLPDPWTASLNRICPLTRIGESLAGMDIIRTMTSPSRVSSGWK